MRFYEHLTKEAATYVTYGHNFKKLSNKSTNMKSRQQKHSDKLL